MRATLPASMSQNLLSVLMRLSTWDRLSGTDTDTGTPTGTVAAAALSTVTLLTLP
jgi:hypothetical protein